MNISFTDMMKDILTQKYGINMKNASEHWYKILLKERLLSISNSNMSEFLCAYTNAYHSECFIIKEGHTDHFIMDIDGANKLKNNLLRLKACIHERSPYRKGQNEVALRQTIALIEYLEETK